MKKAWVANIPHAVATLDHYRKSVEISSEQGLYNAVLARTGSHEEAEKELVKLRWAMAERMAKKHAADSANGMTFGQ